MPSGPSDRSSIWANMWISLLKVMEDPVGRLWRRVIYLPSQPPCCAKRRGATHPPTLAQVAPGCLDKLSGEVGIEQEDLDRDAVRIDLTEAALDPPVGHPFDRLAEDRLDLVLEGLPIQPHLVEAAA